MNNSETQPIALPELLPCPFCGGNAHFGTIRFGKNAVPKEDRERVNYFISCELCQARTQTITGYRTKQEASDQWNTRTSPVSADIKAALSDTLRTEMETLIEDMKHIRLSSDLEEIGTPACNCGSLADNIANAMDKIFTAIAKAKEGG